LRKIYSGKTKDVFVLEDGNMLLRFKDTVTGIGTQRNASLLQKAGMPTHFIGLGPVTECGS